VVVISGSIILPALSTDIGWYDESTSYDVDVHQLWIAAGNDMSSRALQVRAGVLRRVDVRIPYGHGALARLQVWDQARQVLPAEADHWIKGNRQSLTYELNWPLQGPPYELTLRGWNEDDSYPHRFDVDFHILTAEDVQLLGDQRDVSLGEAVLELYGL